MAASSLCNPADAKKVLAVGAIDYNYWTMGPAEPFRSQGPTNDGRIKPEINGPDGVTTSSYDRAFYGTSASSPHVAGAAALILANNPRCSVQGLWKALTRSAVDMFIGASEGDNVYGYGRLSMPSDPTLPQCVVTMPGMLPLLLDD